MKHALTAAELETMLNLDPAVQVIDVRLVEDRAPVAHQVPGARWLDPNRVDEWSQEIESDSPVVVFCVHGLRVSQSVRQELASRGFNASILEGGIDAWQEHVQKRSSDGG